MLSDKMHFKFQNHNELVAIKSSQLVPFKEIKTILKDHIFQNHPFALSVAEAGLLTAATCQDTFHGMKCSHAYKYTRMLSTGQGQGQVT